tara:strand:- start:2155 stop:2316 length:162 start_codon:yes stop_codon:yes gene_type:complete
MNTNKRKNFFYNITTNKNKKCKIINDNDIKIIINLFKKLYIDNDENPYIFDMY